MGPDRPGLRRVATALLTLTLALGGTTACGGGDDDDDGQEQQEEQDD